MKDVEVDYKYYDGNAKCAAEAMPDILQVREELKKQDDEIREMNKRLQALQHQMQTLHTRLYGGEDYNNMIEDRA